MLEIIEREYECSKGDHDKRKGQTAEKKKSKTKNILYG